MYILRLAKYLSCFNEIYQKIKIFVKIKIFFNKFIYTTAIARLKMYTYIEQLQGRVLYFDTDSIIYLKN